MWHESYEAEQHLLHHGQADECVCWTLAGFASGYLSKAQGRTVYCIEETCRGKGDPVCRMVGRYREDWPAAQQAFFTFYESDCLNEALSQLQAQLKKVDRRLAQRRRELEAEQDDVGPGDPQRLDEDACWTRRAGWPRWTPACCCRASRARARNASPATSTTRRGGRPGPSWRSTARRCPSR